MQNTIKNAKCTIKNGKENGCFAVFLPTAKNLDNFFLKRWENSQVESFKLIFKNHV